MRKKDKERSTENNIGQIRIDYTLPVVKIWEIYLNNPEKNFFYLKDYAGKSGHGLEVFFRFFKTHLPAIQKKHRDGLLEIVKPAIADLFGKIETSADMRKQIEKFLQTRSLEIITVVWRQPRVIQLMKKGLLEDKWDLVFGFFVSVLRTQRAKIFSIIWHDKENDIEDRLSLSIFLKKIPQTAENEEEIISVTSLSGSIKILDWVLSLRPSLQAYIQQTLESTTIALKKKIFFSEKLFVVVRTSPRAKNEMPYLLSSFFENIQDVSFFKSLRDIYSSESKKKYSALILPYLDKTIAALSGEKSPWLEVIEPEQRPQPALPPSQVDSGILSKPASANVTTVPDFSFFSPRSEEGQFLFETVVSDIENSDTFYKFS